MSTDDTAGTTEVVIALYRPKPGQDEALLSLVDQHLPALRAAGLATDSPTMLLRSQDGTLVEILEWRDAAAADEAHRHPRISALWEAMAEVADFVALGNLPEASRPFSHFTPVAR